MTTWQNYFLPWLRRKYIIEDNQNSLFGEINDKTIVIKDKTKAKKIIGEWDGYIHSEVKETDAVENKNRLGGW